MKLKKLIIKNIASFADAEIDFSEEPLHGSRLFLICGETGSGKTTLLDAVCLALYKDAPRMQRIDERTDPNADPAILGNKDPRQLMRQGTAEASAILLFTGNDGRDYKAEWEVHRAHNNPAGALQKDTLSWTDLSGARTWDKEKDIAQVRENAIGLTYEQFCRTCMLAQGEFSKFLFAKEKEKADILEKLTGTGKYTKIAQTIFEKYSACRHKLEVAEQTLQNVTLLTEEEVAEHTGRLRELNADINGIRQQESAVAGKCDWLDKQGGLARKLQDIRTAIAGLQKQKESDGFRSMALLVADWDRTAEPRLQYGLLRQQEEALSGISRSMEALKDDFMDLSGQAAGLSADLEDKRAELQQNKDYVARRSDKNDMYGQADAIGIQLANYYEAGVSMAKCKGSLNSLQSRLPGIEQHLSEAVKAEAELQAKNDSCQKEIDGKNAALAAKNPRQLESDWQNAYRQLEKLTSAAARVQGYEDEKSRLAGIEKELSDLQVEKQKAENDREALKREVAAAQAVCDKTEEVYGKTVESVSDYAKELRRKLHAGDTCPVCGQKIGAMPDDGHFESVLEPLEKSLNAAKQDLQDKKSSLNQKEAAVGALEHSIRSKSAALTVSGDKVQAVWGQVEKDCSELGVDAHDENVSRLLREMQQERQSAIGGIELKRNECFGLQKDINRLQTAKNELQKQLDKAREAHHAAEEACNSARAEIEKVNGRITDLAKQSDAILSGLLTMNLPGGWLDEFNANPKSYMSDLKTQAALYKDKLLAISKLEPAIGEMERICTQLAAVRSKITEKLPEWASLPSSPKRPSAHIADRWTDLQERVSEKYSKRNAALQQRQSLLQELDGFCVRSRVARQRLEELWQCKSGDIEKMRLQVNGLQKQLDENNGALAAAAKELEDHQAARPEIAESDTVASLQEAKTKLEAQKNDRNKEVGRITQILKADEQKTALHASQKEACDKMREEVQAWEQLKEKIGDKEGYKLKKIIQGYVISQMLGSANYYLKKFNRRYTLHSDGLLLRVADSFMGGAPRGVTSLSGGESFIVSLALALGLSSVGSSQVMETLFIDEGFGTLSSEYLTTVINALNTVSNVSRRQVGIISHVECLRREIPTHVEVHKEGEYQPSTVRVVPKPVR